MIKIIKSKRAKKPSDAHLRIILNLTVGFSQLKKKCQGESFLSFSSEKQTQC